MDFLKDYLNEETLKELKSKLGDELYNQVAEKTADFKLDAKTEKFIPKHRFDEVKKNADDYKEQLDERAKQLEELNKTANGNAELQLKIKELQDANEQREKEFNENLTKTKQQYAYKDALNKIAKDYKPKNIEDVEKFLDKENIKFVEGDDGYNVDGIKEQFENLKTSKAYLFTDETPAGTGVAGSANIKAQNIDGVTAAFYGINKDYKKNN